LSAILGWTTVLRKRPLESELVERGLDTIERNARMQTQLIEDLLDMSRITSGKVRLDIQPVVPVRIVEAALETVRPTADSKGVRLEAFLDPQAGPVSGDPGRLQQILWNLLSNAIKFTPRDGKIQVHLERVNSHVEITVADTGEGIPAEFLPHVFERFRQSDASTTRQHTGLGLGLSIVRHLVELHGGLVRAKSRGIGHGSTFVVQLPVALLQREPPTDYQHPRTPAPVPVHYDPDELAGVRILVVDDEVDGREILAVTLEGCGAIVASAQSGAEALGLVETFAPDVLISDIGMPQMDGYEFLRRVRAQSQRMIPAIALTAFARPGDRTRALRAGFLVHVSKPVEPGELVATIAAALGRWSL
jgi:CheY-like chemotaxis protein